MLRATLRKNVTTFSPPTTLPHLYGSKPTNTTLSAFLVAQKKERFQPQTIKRTFSNNDKNPVQNEKKLDKFLKVLRLHPSQIVAGEKFNRYWLVAAAMANHLFLGAIFAWSIFNEPLTRLEGVIVPGPHDWVLGDISVVFSLVMGGFVWAGLLGKTLDQVGPRASCLMGALCLGSGFLLGALAIYCHSLSLLYLGGLVWGFANGWAYVPPVSTLLKWFPDRKGFASGSCILGFGAGASVAAPIFTYLLKTFRVAPDYLGHTHSHQIINEGGKLFVEMNGQLKEVLVATATDVKAWGLEEGLYLLGTGSTGLIETFAIFGIAYSFAMALTALVYRLPPPSYINQFKSGPSGSMTHHDVDVGVASRSRQFWLMWLGFGCSITGSYGILSAGKTMLTEVFSSSVLVTAGFGATFVGMMGMANLGGRIFWSNMSDWAAKRLGTDPFYGRRLIFTLMWITGPPLYLLVVWSVHQSIAYGSISAFPLIVFCASVCGIISSFGGAAATRPAIVGDLFGTKHVGVLTARQLSVVMPAAYMGPKLVTYLREKSINECIHDLSNSVSDKDFHEAFGVGKDQIPLLIEQKSITVNRLLELVPPETIDPTPFIYDQTMYIMAALQTIALITNFMLKPVDPKYHIKEPAKIENTPQVIEITENKENNSSLSKEENLEGKNTEEKNTEEKNPEEKNPEEKNPEEKNPEEKK